MSPTSNGRDFQLCTFMWQTQNGVCSVWYIGKCKFSVVDIFAKFALKTFCIAVTENSSLFLSWKHFQIIESVRKHGFELALFHCKHTPLGGKLRKWLRGKANCCNTVKHRLSKRMRQLVRSANQATCFCWICALFAEKYTQIVSVTLKTTKKIIRDWVYALIIKQKQH